MAATITRISDIQFQNATEWLSSYVAIPSVSDKNSPDYSVSKLQAAADFALDKLRDLQFDVSSKTIKDSPPFILATRVHNKALPTILLYTHYDVQPVQRDQWSSDPFTPEVSGERLYGRGSADSKGNIAAIFAAIDYFNSLGKEPPVNIKILFEGEEEIGSPNINALLEQFKEELESDVFIVMDAPNKNLTSGTISISTRGCVSFQMRITALKAPVHSGTGCLVPDPAMALCHLVASLAEPLLIPGFKRHAKSLSMDERIQLRKDSISYEEYHSEMGVLPDARLRGFRPHSIYEKIMGDTPSLSILNMTAGTPNGGNSIPSFAECQIGIRTLIGQNPFDVSATVIAHLKNQKILWNLPLEIQAPMTATWAWAGDINGPYHHHYTTAFNQVFGESTITPCGGSLPLYHKFTELFPSTEIIPIGAIDPASNIHGHNESQHLPLLRKHIDALICFMELAPSPLSST